MRSLEDITDAVCRNEPATEDELRLAIRACDVLLAQLQLENNPVFCTDCENKLFGRGHEDANE